MICTRTEAKQGEGRQPPAIGRKSLETPASSTTTQPLHPLTPPLVSEILAIKSKILGQIFLVKILFILDMRLAGTLDGRSGSDASSWDRAAVSCNSQYSFAIKCLSNLDIVEYCWRVSTWILLNIVDLFIPFLILAAIVYFIHFPYFPPKSIYVFFYPLCVWWVGRRWGRWGWYLKFIRSPGIKTLARSSSSSSSSSL